MASEARDGLGPARRGEAWESRPRRGEAQERRPGRGEAQEKGRPRRGEVIA